jgi:hypothetical protein
MLGLVQKSFESTACFSLTHKHRPRGCNFHGRRFI